jgi:LuxR family transcriptional regulator
VHQELDHLRRMCPLGYFIGLHLRYMLPCYTYNSYPDAWMSLYQRRSYIIQDPVFSWISAKAGQVRWSDLAQEGKGEVFAQAARFGLKYGAVVAHVDGDSRSFGSFARDDREFDDNEIRYLRSAIERLHVLTDIRAKLSKSDIETIRAVENQSYSDAATQLGIAEVTVKHRIGTIRRKLQARDGKEIVFLAREAQIMNHTNGH